MTDHQAFIIGKEIGKAVKRAARDILPFGSASLEALVVMAIKEGLAFQDALRTEPKE